MTSPHPPRTAHPPQRAWRTVACAVALLGLTAVPAALAAQRTTTADSVAADATGALVLDFVEQDVSVVLRAIAEAGGLSVTLSNMPSARVTLRLRQPASREATVDALRAVAEGQNITVTEGAAVIRLAGPPRTPARPSEAPRALALYTLRLQHAAATEMAPLLMNVLTGAAGSGTTSRRARPSIAGGQAIRQGAGGIPPTPAGGARPMTAPERDAEQSADVLREMFGANSLTARAQQVRPSGGANAFTDTRIVADEATNALVIRATPDDFAAIEALVATLDLRPLQVLIEVTIAQVDRSGDLSLGLSGTATRREGRNAGDTLGLLPGAGTPRDFVAMLTGGRGTIDFDLAINALQTRGDVQLLSLPVIIAQNNREATLNVGSSVPFVQVSQTGGFDPLARVETVQYLPVGKQLTITPTINTDGYVNMDVVQTNDDVSNNLLFDAPIINQRQAQTSVFVRDGQTTVIGGLTDNTTDESSTGIPFLSRLPLIGWLFGSTRTSTRTTEIYLFLTPHIVSSDEDLDRLRESVRDGSALLREVPIDGRIRETEARRDSARRDSVRRDSLPRGAARRRGRPGDSDPPPAGASVPTLLTPAPRR